MKDIILKVGLGTNKSQPCKGGQGPRKIFQARRSSTCDYTGGENNREIFSNCPFRLIRAVEGLQAMQRARLLSNCG